MTIFMKNRACIFVFTALVLLATGCRETGYRFVKKTAFKDADKIVITFAGPVDESWGRDTSNYSAYEKPDPDIPLTIIGVILNSDRTVATLVFKDPLNHQEPHIVAVRSIESQGMSLGSATLIVKQGYFSVLLSILIGAMLVQNFVFSRYLGLCIFFGTSQRKVTAIGMGISFTIVMICSVIICWGLYNFILKPFRLDFLQVLTFIGIVAMFTQLVDTILRKVNPLLFKKLGVYLVLIVTNCIILAVPLIMADNAYDFWESLMLAVGAGFGFMIALFLMASVRERLEVANVPPSFRGLPIAFVIAGLFALAFMGFSGLSIF
jgi:electron transport complex protein RnfA